MANWASSGRVVNPAADQVIIDSGALGAGNRALQIVVASSVTATFELQYRNAANDTTLKSQIFALPGAGTFEINIPTGLDNVANERFRIITVGAITGTVSCSVFT
jgi:hypothetical protein